MWEVAYTLSLIVLSIGAMAIVRYSEVIRWWEGPLWEVPLYYVCLSTRIITISLQNLKVPSEINNSTNGKANIGQSHPLLPV